MKNALLVVNPSSGGEKAPEFQKQALEKLKAYFDYVEVKETKKAGEAPSFNKEDDKKQFDSANAMGGERTVNAQSRGIAN